MDLDSLDFKLLGNGQKKDEMHVVCIYMNTVFSVFSKYFVKPAIDFIIQRTFYGFCNINKQIWEWKKINPYYFKGAITKTIQKEQVT